MSTRTGKPTNRRFLWRDLYIAAVCAAAGLLLAFAFQLSRSEEWSPWGVGILFVLIVVCERVSVPLPREGDVSVSTIPHIVAALLLPPWLAMALGGAGMLVDQVAARLGPRKLLFNTGSCVVTLGVTAFTADALGLHGADLGVPDRWQQVPAFLVVSAVYYLATNLQVSTVVVLSTGGSLRRTLVANGGFSVPAEFAVCVIGGLIAVMWRVSPAWVPLILFPAVISQIAITYIAASRRKSDELRHQALHDMLTGLPNRGYLAMRLRETFEEASSVTRPFSLLMMDLNRFKEVNDTFGHSYGDELLREVGRRLHAALRQSDVLARLGGDEFAVLLPATEAEHADAVARDLVRTLQEPVIIENERLYVGGSVGIASYPLHATNAAELMRRADIAMYAAKRGHHGTTVYSADLEDDNSSATIALSGELRQAIERSELRLHFQPKLTSRDGRLSGVEALVCWQHPERGLLGPDQFISFAERTGLIQQIGRWALNAALRQCRDWADRGLNIAVAVNFTAKELQQPSLVHEVAGVLARYDLPADHLCVEVTESMLIGNMSESEAVLRELAQSGVRIAIDDFGTGYSSLPYLRRLPVDEVKIDRSFLHDFAIDTTNAAIVEALISLGHALGLTVTAEGVDDPASLGRLKKLGCDGVQGNYPGVPMDPEILFEWATQREIGDDGPEQLLVAA